MLQLLYCTLVVECESIECTTFGKIELLLEQQMLFVVRICCTRFSPSSAIVRALGMSLVYAPARLENDLHVGNTTCVQTTEIGSTWYM